MIGRNSTFKTPTLKPRVSRWGTVTTAIPLFFALKLTVGLALIKLSAHFLRIADFGIFSQFLLFSAYANVLASGGVASGLTREIAAAQTVIRKRSVVRAAMSIWAAIGCLMILGTVLWARQWSVLLTGHGRSAAVVVTLVIAAVVGGLGQIFCAAITGSERGEQSLFAQGVGLIIGGGGAIASLCYAETIPAILFFACGPVATSALSGMFARRLRLIGSSPVADLSPVVARLLSYAGSFLFTASLMPVTLIILRYIYRDAFGNDALGFWLAANRISDISTQVLGLFMAQVVLPRVSVRQLHQQAQPFILFAFGLATLMMIGFLLLFWLGAPLLIRMFLSVAYLPAIPLILIYMMGDVIRVSGSLGLNIALARGKIAVYVGLEIIFMGAFFAITEILVKIGNPLAPALGYLSCNILVAIVAWGVIILAKPSNSSDETEDEILCDKICETNFSR